MSHAQELFPKDSSSSPAAAPGSDVVAAPAAGPSGGDGSIPSTPTDVNTVVSSPPEDVTVAVSGPESAPTVSVTVKVYDGYLDQCQVRLPAGFHNRLHTIKGKSW